MSRRSLVAFGTAAFAAVLLLAGSAPAGSGCAASRKAEPAALQQYLTIAVMACNIARARDGGVRDPQSCVLTMAAFLAANDRGKPAVRPAVDRPLDATACAVPSAARPVLQREALLVGR